MSRPPEIKKFMAAAQKAKNNMLRARVQSGVAHGDPLDPLVIARNVSMTLRHVQAII